jgi:hypothetical protein
MDDYQRAKEDVFRKFREGRQPDEPVIIKIHTKKEFLSGFVPPDYLIEGMLQRRFIYSLTAPTGHAKTAIALRIAQLVDHGEPLAGHEVERGRVAYLVGENPDDVRMRVIGDDAFIGKSDLFEQSNIIFIPGVFDTDALLKQVEGLGKLDLIIIDTSAAYFLGEDENVNTDIGKHARKLRRLIELPGGPCVLVLCHPIKHATEVAQLIPRGGGAFLAEVDGNLTAWKDDRIVTLHHSSKFRGAGFEPITFRLDTIRVEELKDSKGRKIPTVRAVVISEEEEKNETAARRKDDDLVLATYFNGAEGQSLADVATALGWMNNKGELYRSRVQRALDRLKRDGLMRLHRDKWCLTDKGKAEAKAAGF